MDLFPVFKSTFAYAQICIGVGRAKWTTVSLNLFTILIIISILVDPFLFCMLLNEKRCHPLFIGMFTDLIEPERQEVHSQRCKLLVHHGLRLKIS